MLLLCFVSLAQSIIVRGDEAMHISGERMCSNIRFSTGNTRGLKFPHYCTPTKADCLDPVFSRNSQKEMTYVVRKKNDMKDVKMGLHNKDVDEIISNYDSVSSDMAPFSRTSAPSLPNHQYEVYRPVSTAVKGSFLDRECDDFLNTKSPNVSKESATGSKTNAISGFDDDAEQDIYWSDTESDFSSSEEEEDSESSDRLEELQTPKSKPVVYRYFGRNRARSRYDHVPFIFLGPSVDHWKGAGQILASKGFSVMACECSEKKNAGNDDNERMPKGDDLVMTVLETLRWERAVVVGCDKGAVAALQAALRLAPSRVRGLILCGDLSDAETFVASLEENAGNHIGRISKSARRCVDDFLSKNISCPSTIIWDGDIHSLPNFKKRSKNLSVSQYEEEQEGFCHDMRMTVLGGGASPHRRFPELFSWALTRFVEEKVPDIPSRKTADFHSVMEEASNKKECYRKRISSAMTSRRNQLLLPFAKNENLQEMLSPESMLVSGRVLAFTIAYVTVCSVGIYQYRNLCVGFSVVKSQYEWLTSWQKQGFMFVTKILTLRNGFLRRLPQLPKISRPSRNKTNNGVDRDTDKRASRDEDDQEFTYFPTLDCVLT